MEREKSEKHGFEVYWGRKSEIDMDVIEKSRQFVLESSKEEGIHLGHLFLSELVSCSNQFIGDGYLLTAASSCV